LPIICIQILCSQVNTSTLKKYDRKVLTAHGFNYFKQIFEIFKFEVLFKYYFIIVFFFLLLLLLLLILTANEFLPGFSGNTIRQQTNNTPHTKLHHDQTKHSTHNYTHTIKDILHIMNTINMSKASKEKR
jgi:hypothetical protein